jgi:nucleotide-binding universal stress UspA family protein
MGGTIVVGFDGSDTSARALDRAITDAKSAAAQLIVVIVAPMPLDPLAPPEFGSWLLGPPDHDEQALQELVAENKTPPALQPIVEQAETRTRDAGIEAEIVWGMGDPAREIVDVARDRSATSIVLGEHHHRRLGILFGEDVSAAVQREVKCDVVSVE